MTIERDLARTAMSFTTGIIISAIVSTRFSTLLTAPATIALLISAACTAILLHPEHKNLNGKALWLIISILFICLGYFISDTGRHISSTFDSKMPMLSAFATNISENLKESIAEIPFREKDTKSLITALITGDKSGLASEIMASFRRSGASHILALSGLHLGIIYGIFKGILSVSGNGRKARILRAVIIVSACGIYTLATVASASITRAFLFILLNETASLTGRYKKTSNILWTALFIQLFFNPGSIKDVGFQLSYAAMAGIAYIYPHLKNFWPEGKGLAYKGLGWIWKSAAMSIACQVTTGPLAWIYFRTFPLYFLLTNLITLPLIGLIIPASLLTLGLHECGICPDFLIGAVENMILGMTRCLEIIASL